MRLIFKGKLNMTRAERRSIDRKKKRRLKHFSVTNTFNAVNDPYLLKSKELNQLRGLLRQAYRSGDEVLIEEYERKWNIYLEGMRSGNLGYLVNNGKYTYPQFVKKYTHARMRQGIKRDINEWTQEEDPKIDIRKNDNKARREYEYAWEID